MGVFSKPKVKRAKASEYKRLEQPVYPEQPEGSEGYEDEYEGEEQEEYGPLPPKQDPKQVRPVRTEKPSEQIKNVTEHLDLIETNYLRLGELISSFRKIYKV